MNNILPNLVAPELKNLGVAFVLGTVLGTGIGIGYIKAVSTYDPPTQCEQIECSQIDPAKYQRLRRGMTLAEVEAILGPGTEQSQTESETVMVWRNAEGYSITVIFVDGKLQERRQL